MILTLDGLQVADVVETNDEITVLLEPEPGNYRLRPGTLTSNFRVPVDFVEENGMITPIIEPITLTFSGY